MKYAKMQIGKQFFNNENHRLIYSNVNTDFFIKYSDRIFNTIKTITKNKKKVYLAITRKNLKKKRA